MNTCPIQTVCLSSNGLLRTETLTGNKAHAIGVLERFTHLEAGGSNIIPGSKDWICTSRIKHVFTVLIANT